jgi:hypothetical protein
MQETQRYITSIRDTEVSLSSTRVESWQQPTRVKRERERERERDLGDLERKRETA